MCVTKIKLLHEAKGKMEALGMNILMGLLILITTNLRITSILKIMNKDNLLILITVQ